MFSIEIYYLWYIYHMFCAILINLFYTKLICILSKFYPVRSFDYRWNNNLTMFLYKRNTCFILENLILFCFWATFLWTSVQELTKLFQCCFLNVEATPMNIRWLNFLFQPNINVKTTLSTLNRRNFLSTLFPCCFANVETPSIIVRPLNFHFQPNISIETTLMNVDDQRCFNVDLTNVDAFAGSSPLLRKKMTLNLLLKLHPNVS